MSDDSVAYGSYTYVRGIARSLRFIARYSGSLGEPERAKAQIELSTIQAIATTILTNPQYLGTLGNIGLNLATTNDLNVVLGRFATGAVITQVTSPAIGLPLSFQALLGDITYNVERGITSAQSIINVIVTGDPYGGDFRIDSKDGVTLNRLIDDLEKQNVISSDVAKQSRSYIDAHTNLERYCFTESTQVLMADGTLKSIRLIEAGDWIMAFECLGELQPRKVTRTFVTHDQEVIQLGEIRVTPGHQFLIPDGSFQSIGSVKDEEFLVHASGKVIPRPSVSSVAGKHTVYNFEVEDLHTYVAGGYRVHNESLSAYQTVSSLGSISGSLFATLASGMADKNLASQIIATASGKTVGGVIGDTVYTNWAGVSSPDITALATRLPGSLATTAFGVVTSELSKSLINGLDIKNPLAQIAVSTITDAVATNIYNELIISGLKKVIANPIEAEKLAVEFFGVPAIFDATGKEVIGAASPSIAEILKGSGVTALGKFAGDQFHSLLVKWNVLGEGFSQKGAVLGSSLSGIVGSIAATNTAVAGFLGVTGVNGAATTLVLANPVLGAVVVAGTVLLGNLLGGLFGDKDFPRASRPLILSADGLFILSPNQGGAYDGGNDNIGITMASVARDTLNTIAGIIGGRPTQTGFFAYGHYEKDYIYKPEDRGWHYQYNPYRFSNPNDAVRAGVMEQLKTVEIQGGDPLMRGVLQLHKTVPSYNPDLDLFLKELEVAKKWGTYRSDPFLYGSTILNINDINAKATLIADHRATRDRAERGLNLFAFEISKPTSIFASGSDSNDNLVGGSSNDAIFGGAGNDTINGGAGDDFIEGGLSSDTLAGNDGVDTANYNGKSTEYRFDFQNETRVDVSDTISNRDGADKLTEVEFLRFSDTEYLVKLLHDFEKFYRTTHADVNADIIAGRYNSAIHHYMTVGKSQNRRTIFDSPSAGGGSAGNDLLQGTTGNDTLLGLAGNDTITGNTGNDQVLGGDGNDSLLGEAGDDTVNGQAGNDYASGGDGNDFVFGETGLDTLVGFGGNDTIRGGDDNDQIFGDAGNDSLLGEAGDDTVNGQAGNDYASGGDGNDFVFGETGLDTLVGFGGNDTIRGGDNNDQIFGDAGNDSLLGDAGDDTVNGQAGNDYASGGEGNDFVFGEAGLDTLVGLGGNDTIRGGDDNDQIFGDAGNDSLLGDVGDDTVNGQAGNDYASGGDGNDFVFGEAGLDTLVGFGGNDTIRGGDDNDQIFGDAGNDSLLGEAGDDIISGGAGFDTLTGGTGLDIFSLSLNGRDTITDFVIGTDKILLSKGSFSALRSNPGTGFTTPLDFAVVATDLAAETSGAIIVFSQATKVLLYNQNGASSGLGTGEPLAILNGISVLGASDFSIVG